MTKRHTAGKRRDQVQPLQQVAIYLRTSSLEAQAPAKSQEGQLQKIEERILNNTLQFPIYKIYADIMTGTSADRAQYQQMLLDAAQKQFAYVVVSETDRLGRDVAEGARAIKELNELGVLVCTASEPNRDPESPEGRFHTNLELALAQLESDRTGMRTRRGMISKYQRGEWPHYAPDGYINKEQKTSGASLEVKKNNGRYERWVEIDPEQAKVVKAAFDLLLQGNMTEKQICLELHARGYRLKKGTPFIEEVNGKPKSNNGALSRIFHNWFYAGWVVVDNKHCKIAPKMTLGKWEPIVTTEDFERAQEILEQRNKKRMPTKKNFYLLQGLIYTEMDEGIDNDQKAS